MQKISADSQIEEDVDEGLKKFCCESVHCQVNYLRQGCGEEAVHFFKTHLEKMSDSLIHQHCASYTYGSDSCLFATYSNSKKLHAFQTHISVIALLLQTIGAILL
ncbi:uncharacterized protein B4U79_06803 [Dinothrombium tinctorium]|uniref:Uncharacterized protein n=1 Tax=Dinothrombium tinctorium TaxID=1965070 RepID=A0A3S3Q9D5_9ACAR|nr:uncharacterized protein B4U79_13078 [Dinothrombium tinctorium]RWS16923.1 uncharacterized protein B4U79_06803 [Dinothrombium tinctorium]